MVLPSISTSLHGLSKIEKTDLVPGLLLLHFFFVFFLLLLSNNMTLRLLIAAGKATPAAPVGPALGQRGLNIMDFCKQVGHLLFAFDLLILSSSFPLLSLFSPSSFILSVNPFPSSSPSSLCVRGQFNARSAEFLPEIPLPVVVLANKDRTFTFQVKSPTTTYLLKKCSGVEVGSARKTEIVGEVSVQQLYEIAKIKQKDENLQHLGLFEITKTLASVARGMGLKIVKQNYVGK